MTLQDLLRSIQGGANAAGQAASGALYGFDAAGKNLTAGVTSLLGSAGVPRIGGLTQGLQQQAKYEQGLANRTPISRIGSTFGSSLMAPGNFAFQQAFKPGFNTVMGAANATAGFKTGNYGYGLQNLGQAALSGLQTATLPVEAPIGFGAKVSMPALQLAKNTAGNTLTSLRFGKPPSTDISAMLGNTSSVAQGLGIKNPFLSTAVDVATDPTAVYGGIQAAKRLPEVAGAVADQLHSVMPFQTHIQQAVDQIRSTPGLANALYQEVADNVGKVGFAKDMKQHFANLGLPEVYQRLSKDETTQMAKYLTGHVDTIPKTLEQKISAGLPKTFMGNLAGNQAGFIDPDLLTGGLNSKLGNRTFNQANAAKTVEDTLAGNREQFRLSNPQALKQVAKRIGVPENASPETEVTVYRAGTGPIKPGEFVTTDAGNAQRYIAQRPGASLNTTKVKLGDLVQSGGLKTEFVFHPTTPTPTNTGPTQHIGLLQQGFNRVRNVIASQGPAGQELAQNLLNQRDRAETLAGDFVSRMPTVRNLSKADFANFVDAAEGKAKPLNATVAKAVGEWNTIRNEIHGLAGDQLDIGKIENYFPHHFDPKQFTRNWQSNIQHLIKTGQAADATDAAQKLRYAADVVRNRKYGNLEASRIVDLPGYDKTKEALFNYIEGASNRISQAETFGPKDEKSLSLINQIAQSGGDADTVKHMYDIAVGAKKYGQGSKQLTGALRRFNTTTKLGLGALTNMGQNVNTATVTGPVRTLAGMVGAMKPEAQDFALKAGITLDGVLSDLKEGGGFAGKVMGKLSAPGFNKVEKFNRVTAAWAGKGYAEDMAKAAANGSQAGIEALQKMGLNPEAIIKRGGSLTPEETIKAARNVVERTQFKVDPQDLPGWANSPWGKTVAQFRTFSYNQTAFLGREILQPAQKGNFAPLARFLAVGLPVGAALTETTNVLRNRKSEENPAKRVMQYAQKVGGAGLASDLITGLFPMNGKYLDPNRATTLAVSTLAGPTFGSLAEGYGALTNAIQGKPQNLERFALRQTPIVGSTLQNTLLPYQSQNGQANTRFQFGQPAAPGQVTAAPAAQGALTPLQASQLDSQIADLKKQQKAALTGSSGFMGIGASDPNHQNQQAQALQGQIDALQAQKDYATLTDKVNKLTTPTQGGILSTSLNTQAKHQTAVDIGKQVLSGSLTAQQAMPLFQKLGADPQQVTYDIAKSLPTEDQASYVMDALQGGTPVADLISNKVLTSAVATQLYSSGAIDGNILNLMKGAIKQIANPSSGVKTRKAKALKAPKIKGPSLKAPAQPKLKGITPFKVKSPKTPKVVLK